MPHEPSLVAGVGTPVMTRWRSSRRRITAVLAVMRRQEVPACTRSNELQTGALRLLNRPEPVP